MVDLILRIAGVLALLVLAVAAVLSLGWHEKAALANREMMRLVRQQQADQAEQRSREITAAEARSEIDRAERPVMLRVLAYQCPRFKGKTPPPLKKWTLGEILVHGSGRPGDNLLLKFQPREPVQVVGVRAFGCRITRIEADGWSYPPSQGHSRAGQLGMRQMVPPEHIKLSCGQEMGIGVVLR